MKKLVFILVFSLVLSLSACQFSAHGALFDEEDRWVASGDTYSFLRALHTSNKISFGRFSGIYTIKRIESDGSFDIKIELDISSGRFQCFLVTKDDEIILLEEGDNHIDSDGSTMRLRIAGDDAKGSMKYTITNTDE
ncbi:MAG: hypothetical protein RBR75_04205 [Acholeplasmataceae bacterium]|jgi:hypothetical protein|nr:hypothetical protein [Acholeplasmataceae bacterium]